MKILGREIQVIASDDGDVLLSVSVTSSEIENLTALFAELSGKCRALHGKVRTAELTRFRAVLRKVS